MSMRRIYRKIARQNGLSVDEVKTEMKKAIDTAWDSPHKTGENITIQDMVNQSGSKPTPEELIQFAAGKVKYIT